MTPSRPDAIPCARCGVAFPLPGRRASHFCKGCRVKNRRERATARRQQKREATRAALAGLDVDESEHLALVAAGVPGLDEFNAAYDDAEKRLVLDRMPAGANSPRGPNEGMSVARGSEIAGVLYGRNGLADRAAAHLWWQTNPHAFYGLHDDDRAGEYHELSAA